MKLRNIKKAPNEIALILAQNEDLRKLLVVDDSDPYGAADPGLDPNDLIEQKYITFYPPVENRIEDFGRNTFITILLDSVNFNAEEGNTKGYITIYVSTNSDHLIIKNNKNRIIEMVDIIETLLNGIKLTSAGIIKVTSTSHVMLSEFHSSYRISCNLADQSVRKAEI